MIVVLTLQRTQSRKALSVQVSHSFSATSAVFDDDHLVSYAGLVPVMTLAEQTGLAGLLAEKVHIAEPRMKSGAANPSPKLVTVVAGMCVGADCIDDIDAVRSGGMRTLFDGAYAPSTVGTLLREFTFGQARQLESVLREHLVALCERVDLLPEPISRCLSTSRWAAGAYPLRALRRQLRLDPVRGDRSQPAACSGNTGWCTPCRRSRRHPAAQDRQHSRPSGPPATPAHPAPAQSLALGARMASIVAQHDRALSAIARHSLTTSPQGTAPMRGGGTVGASPVSRMRAARRATVSAQQ
jgi:hypothetical protein